MDATVTSKKYDVIQENNLAWDTSGDVNYRIILPPIGTQATGFTNAQTYAWCFDNVARTIVFQ